MRCSREKVRLLPLFLSLTHPSFLSIPKCRGVRDRVSTSIFSLNDKSKLPLGFSGVLEAKAAGGSNFCTREE